jgi:hypothetical protein
LRDGAAAIRLTLLSRDYCHLCDEMRAALAALLAGRAALVDVIDVDAHTVLEARYGEHVPVLFLGAPADGIELCRLRLDVEAVQRALEDAPSSR